MTYPPPKLNMAGWKIPFLNRKYISSSGQFIATSAEVTPNGGLVRESPQNTLNSGLGIIVICLDLHSWWIFQYIG